MFLFELFSLILNMIKRKLYSNYQGNIPTGTPDIEHSLHTIGNQNFLDQRIPHFVRHLYCMSNTIDTKILNILIIKSWEIKKSIMNNLFNILPQMDNLDGYLH